MSEMTVRCTAEKVEVEDRKGKILSSRLCADPAMWAGEVTCEKGHTETVQLCSDCLANVARGEDVCLFCEYPQAVTLASIDVTRISQ